MVGLNLDFYIGELDLKDLQAVVVDLYEQVQFFLESRHQEGARMA